MSSPRPDATTSPSGATSEARPPREEPLVDVEAGVAVALGSVAVLYARSTQLLDQLPTLVRALRERERAGHERPVVLVTMAPQMGPRAMLFGEAMRSTFVQHMRLLEQTIAGHCVLLELDGFAAAAIRSVRSGILLMARPKIPVQISPNADEAIAWVLSHAAPREAPTAAAVREVITRLRQRDR